MLVITLYIPIVVLHSSRLSILCSGSQLKDSVTLNCGSRPLSCTSAKTKSFDWAHLCKYHILTPGVATKVGKSTVALAAPALKGRKLSSLRELLTQPNMR